jgi:hypothetical protein
MIEDDMDARVELRVELNGLGARPKRSDDGGKEGLRR